MRYLKSAFAGVMLVGVIIVATAGADPSRGAQEANDASAFRIIDRINREVLASTFFRGEIARTITLKMSSTGESLACIDDYEGFSPGVTSRHLSSPSGPLGSITLLYRPAFRWLKVKKGQLLYDNSAGFDADGRLIPINLFAVGSFKAMYFDDFMLVVSRYDVADGHSLVFLDSDPYRFLVNVHGAQYSIPLGQGFLGPYKVGREEGLRLKKGELHKFLAFSGKPIKFTPLFIPAASSKESSTLLSSIALMAEGYELQSDKTQPLSDQNANPIQMPQFLVIIDIRTIEDTHGYLTWSQFEGNVKTIQFERGSLQIGIEKLPNSPQVRGLNESECIVAYPYLVLKGATIRLTLASMSRLGKQRLSRLKIQDCLRK